MTVEFHTARTLPVLASNAMLTQCLSNGIASRQGDDASFFCGDRLSTLGCRVQVFYLKGFAVLPACTSFGNFLLCMRFYWGECVFA
jgi:hypothetical protein